jgi:hypothetical protein
MSNVRERSAEDDERSAFGQVVKRAGSKTPWARGLCRACAVLLASAINAIPVHAQAQAAQIPLAASNAANDAEVDAWDWVKDTSSAALIQTYLDRYPAGAHAADAQAKIVLAKKMPSCANPRLPSCQLEVVIAIAAAKTEENYAKAQVAASEQQRPAAEDAAQKADTVAGYKSVPINSSDANRNVIGQYKGRVTPGTDIPQGPGIVTWTTGGRYEGEWKNGEPDGTGIDTSPTLDITEEGQWADGRLVLGVVRNGAPTVNVERVGQFGSDALLNGYGIERDSDGTIKVGNWHLGVMNGYGAKIYGGRLIEQGLYFHGTLQNS